MIDWNAINTVFLDMDGTLLDLHYDNYFWLHHLPQRLADIRGESVDSCRELLQQMYSTHQGTLNWYCLDFWEQALQIDLMGLKREVADRVAYRPSVKAFLRSIHAHGLDVAIVTNAHYKSIEIKLERTDIGEQVDEIISSHDFGLPKEDERFWHQLQQRKPYDPETTAFFDDNEAVLRSAERSGIRHLYSIAHPDSQQAQRLESEFVLIHDFKDIMPAS
ncbi:MAG: GMP/IMP nucleotidase [Oleiphilaceae bacterium]|nr:GMP/IMP nucleotidase [Oleiphilaceae bacterium]